MHPLRFMSLFSWSVADNQLPNGLSLGSILVLLAIAMIASAAATFALDHLNVPQRRPIAVTTEDGPCTTVI